MRYLRLGTLIAFAAALVLFGYTVFRVFQKDVTAPVMEDSIGQLHLNNVQDQSALLEGLTAKDDRDGDITGRIVVERISHFTETGVCNVSYVVFDSSNNICKYDRQVVFDDYTAPRLSLEKPLLYYEGNEITFMDRLHLTHVLEGDISHKLRLEASNVDPSEVGIYEIQVRARTAYGEDVYARLPLNVITYDSQAPIINLTQNLVYIKVDAEFDPKDYVSDVKDCNKNEIDVDAVFVYRQVDTSKPGYGQVRMEVTDQWGHRGITFLTVIVEE